MHGSIPEQDENRKALMSVGKNKRGSALCFREGLVPESTRDYSETAIQRKTRFQQVIVSTIIKSML